MEQLVKQPKLWGLGSFTNSFDILRSTIMSENRSFRFLKIARRGSLMPRPYLPIFSSKTREDKTNVLFWRMFFFFFFFKIAKNKDFKNFSLQNFKKKFKN